MGHVLGMILAGGQGARLAPLTLTRSKPAVPFAAKYRIIDFALNNFVNSGVYGIYVLTQFKAQSLTEHIQRHWRFGTFLDDHFIVLVPAQMRRYEELGPVWYRGTADAVFQNQHLIERSTADTIAVFGGDHIYKMNIAHMLEAHEEARADLTVAAHRVPASEANRFGVCEADSRGLLTAFFEKPPNPAEVLGTANTCLASMGNYLFRREGLLELLERDAADAQSSHDFGKDLIPQALRDGYRIHVYDFTLNPVPGQEGPNTYWRDVGTLDAYFEASMDLVDVVPEFDLFNHDWPLRTGNLFSPPSKFVHNAEDRIGSATDSLLAGGIIVSGGTVRNSVLSRRVRINSYASVDHSVLFGDVVIGRRAKIRNSIIDKNVVVPPGAEIGFDPDVDRGRGFTISEGGVVVVPSDARF